MWEPLRIKKETNYTVTGKKTKKKKAVKLVFGGSDDLKVAQVMQ